MFENFLRAELLALLFFYFHKVIQVSHCCKQKELGGVWGGGGGEDSGVQWHSGISC